MVIDKLVDIEDNASISADISTDNILIKKVISVAKTSSKVYKLKAYKEAIGNSIHFKH